MNEKTAKRSFWDNPLLASRVKSKDVKLAEMVFGYFIGPFGVLIMTTVVSTYYLSFYQTYDDIVAQGSFLTLLPLLSVIPMSLANIIIGILIGKTRTSQGKARPYILTAAPLLLVFGIVMFVIPYWSLGLRMLWMAITFNLFAALANPLYGTAHYLMVSVSTRDLKQRGMLSVVSNIPAVAANGLVGSILMPLVLGWIRSAPTTNGNDVIQNRWQMVMTAFSIVAFVCCILEYLFTRERITEEDMVSGADQVQEEAETVPTGVQLKSAMSDRFWWVIMIFYALYQSGVMFKGGYVFNNFCNEFFKDITVFGIQMGPETVQSILALISGVPLAAGMLFIWPLANKFGKKNMIMVGLMISIAGSVVCLLAPGNFYVMLIGQTLKGFSSIPGAYIMMALFADVLDHLEARFGYRVDGISMSVYNTIITVINGLAMAVFNFFYFGGFFAPSAVAVFFFVGFEIIAHGVLLFVIGTLTVEKNIEEEQKLIAERKAQAK